MSKNRIYRTNVLDWQMFYALEFADETKLFFEQNKYHAINWNPLLGMQIGSVAIYSMLRYSFSMISKRKHFKLVELVTWLASCLVGSWQTRKTFAMKAMKRYIYDDEPTIIFPITFHS